MYDCDFLSVRYEINQTIADFRDEFLERQTTIDEFVIDDMNEGLEEQVAGPEVYPFDFDQNPHFHSQADLVGPGGLGGL